MKLTRKTWLSILLAVGFLAAGVVLMLSCIRTAGSYKAAILEAETALAEVDIASVEDAEQAVEDLQAENEALESNIAALETENAASAETLNALQSEYDAACADEDTAYYLAVLESLREGVALVENEIENPR